MVIVAPGMAAPLASVTVPEICPVLCPNNPELPPGINRNDICNATRKYFIDKPTVPSAPLRIDDFLVTIRGKGQAEPALHRFYNALAGVTHARPHGFTVD